jgi:murein L,D-transpeptidase YcbB/YkuD
MIRDLIFAFGVVATAGLVSGAVRAEQPDAAGNVMPPATSAMPTPIAPEVLPPAEHPAKAVPATPEAEALRKALSSLAAGATDEERNERAALVSFYEARGDAPLWLSATEGLTPKASALLSEIKQADEWGLDPRDFPLAAWLERGNAAAPASPEAIAEEEIGLSQAVLRYGRFARGGRIIHPAEQLSSYLDRRPQLLKPKSILDGVAADEHPDAYLRGLHPQHPQFERLRQKYLALLGRTPGRAKGPSASSAEAKRLLANMEQWRWMPVDMGEFYIWNNIPEYTQRVVKNGEVVLTERIVAGEIGKQTPIFTRPIRKVTFKPTWKVPESIKVRELWPSLLKGGGLMREWGLEVYTKDGQPLDWRKMDWAKLDIREYDVIQPNGPKSVMGKVKFSFPNQHTVFMHDTLPRDKYMFNAAQRTYSHGCMRVGSPQRLAEILLREDKGWDAAQVAEAFNTGPLNNEVAIERKIPVHTTYFTASIDDDGKLHTFPDVYGHERRIVQALEGKWDQIVKGRDHLAPVELDLAAAADRRSADDGQGASPGRQTRAQGKGDSGATSFKSVFGAF